MNSFATNNENLHSDFADTLESNAISAVNKLEKESAEHRLYEHVETIESRTKTLNVASDMGDATRATIVSMSSEKNYVSSSSISSIFVITTIWRLIRCNQIG